MKYRVLLIFIMYALGATSVHSAIYSYIDRSEGTIQKATYYYTIASWDFDDPTPNPCYGARGCTLFVGHRHNRDGSAGPHQGKEYRIDNRMAPLTSTLSIGGLGVIFNSKNPMPFSDVMTHTGSKITEECVGIFYKTSNSTSASGALPMPGSVCGIAPPPAGICGFENQGPIILDHGNLISGDSQSISYNLKVTCSETTNVAVNMIVDDNSNISLSGPGGRILSNMRLNGIPAKSPFRTNAGPAGVIIDLSSSVKIPTATTAGQYNGSSTIILTVQ